MIIVDQTPKPSTSAAQGASAAGDSEPPPYTPSTAALPRIRPSNFLSVTRSGTAPLSAAYVLDPLLHIPTSLLPSQAGTGERPNLRIRTDAGSLNAEVWVVPYASAAMRGVSNSLPAVVVGPVKASIEVASRTGPVCLRIHTPAMPVSLHIFIQASSVVLALPQSYRGAFSASGLVKLSPGMDTALAVFEEVDELQRGWIGDFAAGEEDGDSYGSDLHIETSGGVVSLSFVGDDQDPSELQPPPSPSTESSVTRSSSGPTFSSGIHSPTPSSPISQLGTLPPISPLLAIADELSLSSSQPSVVSPSPPLPPPPSPIVSSSSRTRPTIVTATSPPLPSPAPDLAFIPCASPEVPNAGLDNIPRGLVNWLVRSLEQRFGISSQVSIQMGEVKWETSSLAQPHKLCKHAKGEGEETACNERGGSAAVHEEVD